MQNGPDRRVRILKPDEVEELGSDDEVDTGNVAQASGVTDDDSVSVDSGRSSSTDDDSVSVASGRSSSTDDEMDSQMGADPVDAAESKPLWKKIASGMAGFAKGAGSLLRVGFLAAMTFRLKPTLRRLFSTFIPAIDATEDLKQEQHSESVGIQFLEACKQKGNEDQVVFANSTLSTKLLDHLRIRYQNEGLPGSEQLEIVNEKGIIGSFKKSADLSGRDKAMYDSISQVLDNLSGTGKLTSVDFALGYSDFGQATIVIELDMTRCTKEDLKSLLGSLNVEDPWILKSAYDRLDKSINEAPAGLHSQPDQFVKEENRDEGQVPGGNTPQLADMGKKEGSALSRQGMVADAAAAPTGGRQGVAPSSGAVSPDQAASRSSSGSSVGHS